MNYWACLQRAFKSTWIYHWVQTRTNEIVVDFRGLRQTTKSTWLNPMSILCLQPTFWLSPPFLLTFLLEHQFSSSIHNVQSVKIVTFYKILNTLQKYFLVHIQRPFSVLSQWNPPHSTVLSYVVFPNRCHCWISHTFWYQGSDPFTLFFCHIMTSPSRPNLIKQNFCAGLSRTCSRQSPFLCAPSVAYSFLYTAFIQL